MRLKKIMLAPLGQPSCKTIVRQGLITLIAAIAVIGASSTDVRADAVNANAQELIYCGIGTRFTDTTKAQEGYVRKIIKDIKKRGDISKSMRAQAENINPTFRFVNQDQAKGILGISFLVSDDSFEQQKFNDPITKKDRYNNIFRVSIDTVVFNISNLTVVGLYPWTFQYNEASDAPLDANAQLRKFTEFFKEPAVLKEGEVADPSALLNPWKDVVAKLRITGKEKQMAALPIEFTDATLLAINNKSAGADAEKQRSALTAALEGMLSTNMRLPIVPNGGVQSEGSSGASIKAEMDSCFNGQAQTLSLGAPSYRVDVKVDALNSAAIERSVARTVMQNGNLQNINVSQTEVGYGGRYIVKVVSPGATAADDRVLVEMPLKFVSSKRYFGTRSFQDSDQYIKLTRAFMNELVANLVDPKEDWLKEHLSSTADKKLKPSDLKKTINMVVKEKIGVQPEGKK